MTTKRHATVSGHSIEYEARPKVAAFLRRIADAVHDNSISERELTGLAFSSKNPMLDHSLFPVAER